MRRRITIIWFNAGCRRMSSPAKGIGNEPERSVTKPARRRLRKQYRLESRCIWETMTTTRAHAEVVGIAGVLLQQSVIVKGARSSPRPESATGLARRVQYREFRPTGRLPVERTMSDTRPRSPCADRRSARAGRQAEISWHVTQKPRSLRASHPPTSFNMSRIYQPARRR